MVSRYIYSVFLVSAVIVFGINSSADYKPGELVFHRSDLEAKKLYLKAVKSDLRGRICFIGSEECLTSDQFVSMSQFAQPQTGDQKIKPHNILKFKAADDEYFQVSYVVKINESTALVGRRFSYSSKAFQEFMKFTSPEVLRSGIFEHSQIFSSEPYEVIDYHSGDFLVADDSAKCVDLQVQKVCQNTGYGAVGVSFIFNDSAEAILCSPQLGCGSVNLSSLSDVDEFNIFQLGDFERLRMFIKAQK